MRYLKDSNLIFALSAMFLLSGSTNLAAQSPSALDTLKSNVSSDIDIKISTPLPKFSHSITKAPDNLYGEELFQYLHGITAFSIKLGTEKSAYTSAKSYMYAKADNVTCNGRPGIITFYSLICANGTGGTGADYNELGDANGDGTYNDEINAEHIWPQSAFDQKYPMRADIHHLRPTYTKPNNMRSNYPFDIVDNWDYSTSAGSKRGDHIFEPCDEAKGEVARAVLYFVVRYYDRNIDDSMSYYSFWKNRVEMFLDWHKKDPPNAHEKRRNDLIEEYQGNRNPFVDDPSLADKIGAQVFKSH
ncbi:MAG: endonuclease [Elusimicrobiota bacterium]|nr:endonuclease [Elusimicrobiota bacterium]